MFFLEPHQAETLAEDAGYTKTTSSFKVTWANPSATPNPSKYEVTLDSHTFTPQIDSGSTLEYTFTTTDGSTSLTAGTDYTVKITSVVTGISCTDEITATFCTSEYVLDFQQEEITLIWT